MPDVEGNQKADSGTDTPLHAYKNESGFGSSDPHPEDVKGDPAAQDILSQPMEERDDPQKNFQP